MFKIEKLSIYFISDGNCESIDKLGRLALANFDYKNYDIKNFAYVNDLDDLKKILATVQNKNAIIVHSILNKEFLNTIKQFAINNPVRVWDGLNPLISILEDTLNETPKRTPELNRLMDKKYFSRMSAIEFAVKYDDGNNSHAILEADIVIIGVSRTSKTPLSIYLANENNVKVANVPLVPEIPIPKELFEISAKKVIGLTNSIKKLNEIRLERLKTMGFTEDTHYTSVYRIIEELEFAEKIMKRLSCPIIDVSNKSIEETATIIMNIIKERKI